MTCPNCGSEETAIIDIDDFNCCSNCGTVLEQIVLEFRQREYNPELNTEKRKADEKDLTRTIYANFIKLAVYFGVPDDILKLGIRMIKEHVNDVGVGNNCETAICVIYIINQHFKPHYELQDYYENCPLPLRYKQVVKTYTIIASKHPEMKSFSWRTPQDQLDTHIGIIYSEIKKQLYGKSRRNTFSLTSLKSKASRLLDLGDMYSLNTGKKSKPAALAAALISGLSLFVEKMDAKKARSKRISYYRRFNFKAFGPICLCSYQTILLHMKEYVELLYACSKILPWATDYERQYVHYNLTDILDLFGKTDGRKPTLALSESQFLVSGYARTQQMRIQKEEIIKEAEKKIEEKTIPSDKTSMLYHMYNLQLHGYRREDLLQWTEGYIRGLSHRIEWRKSSGLDLVGPMDLDQVELDSTDMSDKELEQYMVF